MPTYVYECTHCGDFEKQQSISEEKLAHCPTCGSEVHRIITSPTSFIMKGQGAMGNHCERETPCCGRETRCDKPPCGK